jgi:hypothetical protein
LPAFGIVVREAYILLVQDSIDNVQYWEARLTQHLEARPDSASWSDELAVLQNQRTNPLEISRDRMEELVSERRALLGL